MSNVLKLPSNLEQKPRILLALPEISLAIGVNSGDLRYFLKNP